MVANSWRKLCIGALATLFVVMSAWVISNSQQLQSANLADNPRAAERCELYLQGIATAGRFIDRSELFWLEWPTALNTKSASSAELELSLRKAPPDLVADYLLAPFLVVLEFRQRSVGTPQEQLSELGVRVLPTHIATIDSVLGPIQFFRGKSGRAIAVTFDRGNQSFGFGWFIANPLAAYTGQRTSVVGREVDQAELLRAFDPWFSWEELEGLGEDGFYSSGSR